MLVIQMARRAWGEIRRLPALTRIGLALGLVALLADIAVSALPAEHAHGGHGAHLVALLAMVLVLAGVALDAGHRSTRRH